jgi:hypothetical protein
MKLRKKSSKHLAANVAMYLTAATGMEVMIQSQGLEFVVPSASL